MRNQFLLPMMAVAILVVGCSDPKINSSSEEAFKASIEKVRQSLDDQKRQEFDSALQQVAFSNLNIEAMLMGTASKESIARDMQASLNGKSADDVIAVASAIRAEREAKEREQALGEIKELADKQAASEAASVALKSFQVIRSRFSMKDSGFLGKQPVIELDVKNGTPQAVSRAYFEGTIASPGRAVPWHKDEFNYSIPGGLEPGEAASWSLSPNIFSGWATSKAPADTVFTVVVTRLDGADGKTLYSSRDFTPQDAERLTQLRDKFAK